MFPRLLMGLFTLIGLFALTALRGEARALALWHVPLPPPAQGSDSSAVAPPRDLLFESVAAAELRYRAFFGTLADSLDFPEADSTNRAIFLPRRPRPGAVAQPFRKRGSPAYLEASRGVQILVRVDSVRNVVHIREVVNGRDVRIPYDMPLDEYIRLRYAYDRDRRTADFLAQRAEQQGDKLTNLLRNISEFDIPVPPNPLMSIFGDRSRISLRISGDILINAGFRIEKSDQQSVFLNQTQFSPNFKQQVNVNVNGLIGDKLNIRADWSTERTFDYENNLKIKYTGYEDEIIQSIEAGNVSLQSSSQLVGGSGALFGIKAEFQLGPLRLSTVASQKKGESNHMSINGGATEAKFERHAYDYSENYYFISLDYREPDPAREFRNVYESYYNYRAEKRNAPLLLRPDLVIKDMEVWITRPASAGVVIDPEERPGVAFIDLAGFEYQQSAAYSDSVRRYVDPDFKIESQSGVVEVGNFKRLKKDTDYEYNRNTGILTLNQSVQDDQVIAVSYRVEGTTSAPDDDVLSGTFVSDTRFTQANADPRLVLKLVKPKNLTPAFHQAWKHRVRSIYSLNMRNMKEEDLASFKLVFRNGGQPDQETLPNTSINLLRLFGMDYTDDNGGPPDGKIDYLGDLTINPVRGEIIFPTLEPWSSGLQTMYRLLTGSSSSAPVDPYLYQAVYDTTKTIARQSQQDKLLIVGTTRGASSATYYLGFNIVAGSVRVRLNGTLLTQGTDYTVDEQSGQVRLLKEEAMVAGAKVDIEFEKHDLFSFASKTLLGMRGEMTLGKESFLGFTLLSLNQQTLSDKVRIGEEPLSNTMFGLDARTRTELPFITDALNSLPFIQTKEASSISLQGEFAMMMPDPNTKLSTIPSDESKGLAYIDDFEGSRIFIPLQTAYSVWKMASVPSLLPSWTAPSDTAMQQHRGKLLWYNLPITSSSDRTVVVTDIWPDKLAAREDQRVTVLDLNYFPDKPAPYNTTPDLATRTRSWAGLMRMLPVNATNLVDGNFNYIELWMKVETQNPQAKLLIDLGKISEDVIPNSELNSEDLVVPGSIRNGIVNPGEDIGLDMLTDDQERERYAAEILQYGLDPNDPSGDNYAYSSSDWSKFNGTQANIDDPAGQFPDTEDMNNNGQLDLANDYFQYEVSLDTTTFALQANRNPYVVGGGTDGWYQFRIPLSNVRRTVGSPALDNVEFIRVILTDIENPTSIRVAEFNFTGNQWYEERRDDSTFTVSVVNIEDNPEYSTPPGVIRPRDRTRPDQEVYGNEQSLALVFRSLPDTTIRSAYRLFPNTGVDLFNYETLKMYVHGDDYLDSADYEIVMRFGIDSLNYYEYRAPLYPGWDTRNEIAINFASLTAVKTQRDSCYESPDVPALGAPAGAVFKVKGCPDITSVRTMTVGVRNKHRDGRPISGQVWINELRVIGPDSKNGYAYTASMNLRLADIADVNLNVNHTDPYFHALAERFSANRSWTTFWGMSTTLNLDRVLPKDWQGTQIKVNYSHAENLVKPLLLPGQPDVEVEGSLALLADKLRREGATQQTIDLAVRDARYATQTLEIRDSWTIPTVRLKVPGQSWVVNDVVNRMEMSYNYAITRYRDPTLVRRRKWQWQAHAGYSYDFGKNGFVQPFQSLFDGIFLLDTYKDLKFYYLPTRLGVGANLMRDRTEEVQRVPYITRPYIRSFTHDRSANFGYTLSENSLLNLAGTYNANIQTSLTQLETDYVYDENGQLVVDELGTPITTQRQSSAIFGDIFFGHKGLYFGVPSRYSQQVAINTRPQIPKVLDLDRFVDLTGSYQVNYNWQENLQQAGLGRSASFNSSVNLQLGLRLKAFFDPLFPSSGTTAAQAAPRGPQPPPRRQGGDPFVQAKESLHQREIELQRLKSDSTANPDDLKRAEEEYRQAQDAMARLTGGKAPVDSLAGAGTSADSLASSSSFPGIGAIAAKLALYLIKVPLLDYDNVSFSFSESNTSAVSGVRGPTGFSVFWTTDPFSAASDPDLGPSRMYQLGLVTDPNPSSGQFAFQSAFPFVGLQDYRRGLRVPNPSGTYTDNFSQSNTFSIKTNRPLWEGARLDLTWDLRWSINKNYLLTVNDFGEQTISSITSTGQLERSFLMFPDLLPFSLFGTNIAAVDTRYQALLSDAGDGRANSEKLAQAFEEGLEGVPWLSQVLSGFLPRVNWGFQWTDMQKLSFLEGLADRISIEHRYSSNLTMNYRHSQDNGERITESKRAGYNFSPLLGVTLNFSKLLNGDVSVNSRWGKQKTFELNTSSSNIIEQATDEFTLQATYRRAGFELPLFGVTLKNDVDFSFAFSLNKTNSQIYDVNNLAAGGQPREGTTKITIEPRVRYSISQRVQSSLFYRYQRSNPDSSVGSRVPGTTTHEGGLELRISITGS